MKPYDAARTDTTEGVNDDGKPRKRSHERRAGKRGVRRNAKNEIFTEIDDILVSSLAGDEDD